MNIIGALLNAAAVWFLLKAVEVAPFAVYDSFVLIKHCFSKTEQNPTSERKVKHRYDKNRGKLEFVLSGAGFLRFSRSQGGKRFRIVVSLVPVLIFVLEIFSIFLGGETQVCQTSRDSKVVRAPGLQLFSEGEREVNVTDLQEEISATGRIRRPCLRRRSTNSGVEYLMALCSDLRSASVAGMLANSSFPENDRIAIAVSKSGKKENDFRLPIFSVPFKNSLRDLTMIGVLLISCDVFVNKRRIILANDAINDYVINETTAEEIRNDVKHLEKATNATPSEVIVDSKFIFFLWADLDDFTEKAGNVIYAIMSQSRHVGLRTAAEMSDSNTARLLPEVDLLCEEDFFLSRTVSIIVILIGAVLRLLLIAVPASLSSTEYALLVSREVEEYGNSIEMIEEQQQIVLV